jgi:hypothetical protein
MPSLKPTRPPRNRQHFSDRDWVLGAVVLFGAILALSV